MTKKPYVLFNEAEVEKVFAGKNILPFIGDKLPRGWELTETIVVKLDTAHLEAVKRKLRDLVADEKTFGFGVLAASPEQVELGVFVGR